MGAVMFPPSEAADLALHFNAVTAKVPLRVIDCQADYDAAVAAMDALVDAGAADENHPLADLLALLGTFVGGYDDRHYAPGETTPASVLAFAMGQHSLGTGDLPEIGDEAAVSAVLAGQRDLTLSETRRVAKRLGVSPSAFL